MKILFFIFKVPASICDVRNAREMVTEMEYENLLQVIQCDFSLAGYRKMYVSGIFCPNYLHKFKKKHYLCGEFYWKSDKNGAK